MITGCFLNFKCEADPKGENSFIEFTLHEDRESLNFRIYENGKYLDDFYYNLDKGQVGLFIDCFKKLADRE